MKEFTDIEKNIEDSSPRLTVSERDQLWSVVSKNMQPRSFIRSPYQFAITHIRTTVTVALVLTLILGGGGTTFAAQGAHPGDTLFPIKRTIENTQIALAPNPTVRASLITRFANERITELEDMINDPATSAPSTDATSTGGFQGEVAVTSSSTESKTKSLEKLHEHRNANVGKAVDAALSFMNESGMDESTRDHMLKKIFTAIDPLSVDVDATMQTTNPRTQEKNQKTKVTQNVSGTSEIKIHKNGKRVNIQKRNGKIEIEQENDAPQINASSTPEIQSNASTSSGSVLHESTRSSSTTSTTQIKKTNRALRQSEDRPVNGGDRSTENELEGSDD